MRMLLPFRYKSDKQPNLFRDAVAIHGSRVNTRPTCWQVSQRYGFSPLCVLLCRSMWYFWMNRMLHWSQLKGFSPTLGGKKKKGMKMLRLLHVNIPASTVPRSDTHHCGSSRAAAADTSGWSSCCIDCTGKASHLCDQEYDHPHITLFDAAWRRAISVYS